MLAAAAAGSLTRDDATLRLTISSKPNLTWIMRRKRVALCGIKCDIIGDLATLTKFTPRL